MKLARPRPSSRGADFARPLAASPSHAQREREGSGAVTQGVLQFSNVNRSVHSPSALLLARALWADWLTR